MFYKVLFSAWHLCEKQAFAEWAVGSNGTGHSKSVEQVEKFPGWYPWQNSRIIHFLIDKLLKRLQFTHTHTPCTRALETHSSSHHSWNIFALWQRGLSCSKKPQPSGITISVKGCTWSTTRLWLAVHVKVTSTWMTGPKVPQQNLAIPRKHDSQTRLPSSMAPRSIQFHFN